MQLYFQGIFTHIFLPVDPHSNFVVRTQHHLHFTDEENRGSQMLSDPAGTHMNLCYNEGLLFSVFSICTMMFSETV